MSTANGTRVDSRDLGYNLHSGRRIQYDSPLVSRVSRSPARDVSSAPQVQADLLKLTLGCFMVSISWRRKVRPGLTMAAAWLRRPMSDCRSRLEADRRPSQYLMVA